MARDVELADYKVLGVTDEETVCDCCGRTELKATVALETADGEVVHFGRVCAARAAGVSAAAVDAALRTVNQREVLDRWKTDARAAAAEDARWQRFLDEAAGPGERWEQLERLGGFTAARLAYRSPALER